MKLKIYIYDDDIVAALDPFRDLERVPGSNVKQFRSDDINCDGPLHFDFQISYLTLECVEVEATLSPYVLEEDISDDLSRIAEGYDLVLVDDNYPSSPTFGQDIVLPLAMAKMASDSTWLPVFCLYTKEWRDIQKRSKFGKQLDRLRSEHKKHVAGIAKDSTALLEVIRNVLLIKHATERTKLLEAVLETSGRSAPPSRVQPIGGMVGSSHKMMALYEEIRFKANIDSDVLVIGESGTGKELVARALGDCSVRANKEFRAINANSIPEHLFEALIFGAKKGIYTNSISDQKGVLEEVEGGTLFIDEVQCIPQTFQIKLLRVLQERKFAPLGKAERPMDIRVIYGTSLTPAALSESGVFDTGFIQRIYKLPINIPPLRTRGDDILELATHFIEKYRAKFPEGQDLGFSVSNAAKSAMKRYSWPGNVRQLENWIFDAMAKAAMRHDYELSVADFPFVADEVAPIGTGREGTSSGNFPPPLPTNADKGEIEKKIRQVEEFVRSAQYTRSATLADVGRYVCEKDGSGNPRSFGMHLANHAESYAYLLAQHRGSVSAEALEILKCCAGIEREYTKLSSTK